MGKKVKLRGISFVLALVMVITMLSGCGGERTDSSKKDKKPSEKEEDNNEQPET